jgi:hypothetical protein
LLFVFLLYFIISIYKECPTLLSGRETLIGRSQSRLCFDYLKNFCPNGLTLFPCRWRQQFGLKDKHILHTYTHPYHHKVARWTHCSEI